MIKSTLTIICLFFSLGAFSQDTINPSRQVIIENRTHTNRDFLNHSLVDKNGNIILVGSTENDFTFNDVKIIKLNGDLEELWQKEISFETTYSFDRVHWSHVDENNNIILVCKSLFASDFETLFIVVLDENGNLLWKLPFSELEDIEYGVHPTNILANINGSGNLELAYTNLGLGKDENLWVYEIEPNGQILNEYQHNKLFGFDLYSPSGIEYANKNYYTILREREEGNSLPVYSLIKMNANERVKIQLDFITEDDHALIASSEKQEFMHTNDENLIWFISHDFYLNGEVHRGYSIYYFSENGDLIKFIPIDDTKEKYVIGASKDPNGNLIIIGNDKTRGTEDELKISMQKFAPNGELLVSKTHDGNVWGYTTFFSENNINIYSGTDTMLVFDYDLNLKEEITFDSVNGLDYIPTNFHFINGNGFMTGTVISKMYEGSDFYGQLDYNVKKVEQSVEVKSYNFSGGGTSKTWKNWVKKDKNGEYLVHITDKLGPDNPLIGGSRSNEYSYYYYYDSELNETGVVRDITRVSWVSPSTNEIDAFNINGSSYNYLYDEGSRTFTLTKNNSVVWSTTWENNSAILYDFKVNSVGDLVFRGDLNYGNAGFISVLSLNGNFNSLNYLDGPIRFMKVLDNDWIFTHTDKSFIIFSPNLELISKKETYQSETYANSNLFPSLQIGNRVLVSIYSNGNTDETETRVYDQYGSLEKNVFIHGNLRPRYSFIDNDDLIVLTDSGKQIEHGFSWKVVILNKFENFIGETLPNFDMEDFDSDGVVNSRDRCNNTPLGNPVNGYGCNLFEISDRNFTIQTVGESCFDKADGKIIIAATQNLTYNAVLYKDETEVKAESFNNQLSFQDLTGGKYTVCLTVSEISEFTKCFDLNVDTIKQLFVESKISLESQSLTLNLTGGQYYTIQINDEVYRTSKSKINLPLKEPFNSIMVRSEKSCQGFYEEEIFASTKSMVYPNPSHGVFTIYLGENITQNVSYEMFSVNGMLLKKGEMQPEYGNVIVDISDMSDGQFYYVVKVNNNKVTYTLIKND